MHAWILDIERTANNPNSDIEGLLRISFEVTETADPEALRGSFAAYRALDATIAQNQQRKARPLTLPVLAIGGAEGIGQGAANTMRLTADNVQSTVIPGCGHYCLCWVLPPRCQRRITGIYGTSDNARG